jgi:hypothetical protein
MHSYTHLALSLLLLVAACDMPGTGTTSTTDASTSTAAGSSSDGGDSSTTAADADADSSSTSNATSGEGSGSGDGDSGEPSPACFGDPCTDLCGPGLTCLPHPKTGERMCVAPCVATTCNVEPVSCGVFVPHVPLATCLGVGVVTGCFPSMCDVLADCPAGSVECDAGLCY